MRTDHLTTSRDPRGGHRDHFEREDTKRHVRQLVRRELRVITREVRFRGLQAAADV